MPVVEIQRTEHGVECTLDEAPLLGVARDELLLAICARASLVPRRCNASASQYRDSGSTWDIAEIIARSASFTFQVASVLAHAART